MRIAPVPLQGGVQTIQQSIYLTHENPCGFGQFFTSPMGDTGLTYNEFADILQEGLNRPEIQVIYDRLRQSIAAVNEDPSEIHVLQYLEEFFTYGRTLWEDVFSELQVEGYRPVFSCYEANGTTIFDSDVVNTNLSYPKYIPPTYRDESGDLQYTELILVTPQPFTFNALAFNCPTPRSPLALPDFPPPPPQNPFCVLSLVKVQFYGLLQTPAYWPYIWPRAIDAAPGISGISINQRVLYNSSYMTNQTAMTESVSAISSLLIDTANTRQYSRPGFGFSSRAYTYWPLPEAGSMPTADNSLCYNVCLAQQLTDRQGSGFFSNLQDIFFVRLTLVRM